MKSTTREIIYIHSQHEFSLFEYIVWKVNIIIHA
jgi:hypothetical protein